MNPIRPCLALALAFAVGTLATHAHAADLMPADAATVEPVAAEAAASAPAKSFAYHCADGTKVTARFSSPDQPDGFVDLTLADGKAVTLPQAVSADGGRYTKDDIEFWIKGNGATLTIAGKATTCETKD